MGIDPMTWPLVAVVLGFAASALVVGVAGVRLVYAAEELARRTGLGQAVFGALFLGGTTSLPGIIASVAAAAQGFPSLAISNAVGGISAQTVFLVVADLLYRRANLEHAAASLAGLVQGALLIALLAVPLLAMAGPEVVVLGVHPASLLLVAGYIGGMWLVTRTHDQAMWTPRHTLETVYESEHGAPPRLTSYGSVGLWVVFVILALLVAGAGLGIARTGMALASATGLTETVVGGYLTAISTSLPELVTTIACVRRGALALAVGDILGGNTFDVLFLALSDLAWRGGSIYHAVTDAQVFFIALPILLTAILLLGLLRREEHGIGNIGFEGVLVLVLYAGASLMLWLM